MKKTKLAAFVIPSDELLNDIGNKKIDINVTHKMIQNKIKEEAESKGYKIVGKIKYEWDNLSMESPIYKGTATVMKI